MFCTGGQAEIRVFFLPVLVGDRFVARMDSKADRKQGVLTVHNLHFEPMTFEQTGDRQIIKAIKAFAKFNRCGDITIKKSNHKQYLKAITAVLSHKIISYKAIVSIAIANFLYIKSSYISSPIIDL